MVDQSADLVTREFLRAELAEAKFAEVAESFRRQQTWMLRTIVAVAVLVVAALGLLANLIFFSEPSPAVSVDEIRTLVEEIHRTQPGPAG